MTLFHFGKKKEEKEIMCGCNATIKTNGENGSVGEYSEVEECCCSCEEIGNSIQSIKVLGTGCKSCHIQYENVKKAVKNLDILVEVEYITDMEKVMVYGVMSMPAIVVNEKVVSMGKVLSTKDVEKLFQK